MAEDKKVTGIAKQALIGGIVSIILTPIGVILAFYLGANLSKPKIEIKYTEPKFYYNEKGTFSVPDEIIKPLKGNFQLLQVIEAIGDYEGDSEAIKENEFDEFDAGEVSSTLNQTIETLEFEQGKLEGIIAAIEKWNKGDDLNFEPMNLGQITGGKTIRTLVKEDKNNALLILRNYLTASESRINEIAPVVKYLNDYLKGEIKKERTGKVDFKVGILNSGGTDDVVFPQGEIVFNNTTLKINNKRRPGYVVTKPHSFIEITYEIDLNDNSKNLIEEWEAIVQNSITEDFSLIIKTSDTESTFSGILSAKQK
jgi:hypothetical protein